MANNLKKFNNEAEYSSATLNYPAVSWVVSGDTIHFDKQSPIVANDKVMILFTPEGENTLVLYNCGSQNVDCFDSITVNDVAIANPNSTCSTGDYEGGVDTIIKYGLNQDYIGEEFSGDIGEDGASAVPSFDMFIPSQITAINSLPTNNINSLVVDRETPPTVEFTWSDVDINSIYVPDEAVNTYKAASIWNNWEESIYPISDYQGNLPI